MRVCGEVRVSEAERCEARRSYAGAVVLSRAEHREGCRIYAGAVVRAAYLAVGVRRAPKRRSRKRQRLARSPPGCLGARSAPSDARFRRGGGLRGTVAVCGGMVETVKTGRK